MVGPLLRGASRCSATLVVGIGALSGCGAAASSSAAPPPVRTAPPAAAATTTTPAASPGPGRSNVRHLTIEVNGDLLIHSPVWQEAQSLAAGHGYDFRPMLRLIRPYVRGADLAFCHVETPMSRRPPTGYPIFNSPPALAPAIAWAGWDACDTASNHSLDGGQVGIDATGRALDSAGVRHTGSAGSAAAARRILMLRTKGVRVAYLAYTQVSNGLVQPHPWSLNNARAKRIVADARRARRLGAAVVIVNLHWGDEYVHAPSSAQSALARALTRSPAITAVVGQHVHVVQPIRRVNGKLVVFGEGNLLSNQTPSCCAPGSQDGLLGLLRIRVAGARSRLERVDYVPTWVRHPDFTVMPVGAALRRGLAPAPEMRASWRRTVAVVGRTKVYAPWAHAGP